MDKEQLRDKQGLTEVEFLQRYDASIYERPSVTVDMLIFTVVDEEKENYRKLPEKSLKLLMVKRGVHPYMGQWALPNRKNCGSIISSCNSCVYTRKWTYRIYSK